MPGVARLGDICSGHGCWPPRPNDQASPDVYVNSINTHRESDHWIIHCCDDDCHDGALSRGSSTVFINGLPVARIGDPVSCGSSVAQGSSDVFAGG